MTTLTEMAGRPSVLRGTGPIDPWLARDLAAAAARNPKTTWCVTVTDGQGHAVGHGCAVRAAARWELASMLPTRSAACQARTTVDGALKLYVRDPTAPPLTWQGDRELADGLAGVKAVLG